MRFVAFAPSRAASPVARSTSSTLTRLAELGHSVTVVTIDMSVPDQLVRYGPGVAVLHHSNRTAVLAAAAGADLVTYDIGNSFADFGGAIEWIRRLPGHVIAHDGYLGDLLADFGRSDPEAAGTLAWRFGARYAERTMPWARSDDPLVVDAPETWTEWLLSDAAALIAHTPEIADLIGRRNRKQVTLMPVAASWPARPARDAGSPRSQEAGGLVVSSIVGRGLGSEISQTAFAISAFEGVRRRVEWRVVGSLPARDEAALAALARDLGVRLSRAETKDPEETRREVTRADLVVGFAPRLLGALLPFLADSMLAGVAVAVDDRGAFPGLPRDAALVVSATDRQADLARALRAIVDGDLVLAGVARAAAEYASVELTDVARARRLAALAERSVRDFRPTLEERFPVLRNWPALADESPASVFDEDLRIFS